VGGRASSASSWHCDSAAALTTLPRRPTGIASGNVAAAASFRNARRSKILPFVASTSILLRFSGRHSPTIIAPPRCQHCIRSLGNHASHTKSTVQRGSRKSIHKGDPPPGACSRVGVGYSDSPSPGPFWVFAPFLKHAPGSRETCRARPTTTAHGTAAPSLRKNETAIAIAPRLRTTAIAKGKPARTSTNTPPIMALMIIATFHNRINAPRTRPC